MHRSYLSAFAFLVLSSFCVAVPSAQLLAESESGTMMHADSRTGTILIDAELNGRSVVMILDTGASHSLFDATTFGMTDAQLQIARMNSRGLGLDADVVWRTADFRMAGETWAQKTVEIADLRGLSKIYGRKIDGILGEDVLRSFKSVQVNYKWGCVMFER